MFHRNLPSKFVISTLPSSQVRTYWITVRFLVLLFLERLHLQSSVNKDRRSLPRNPEERRRRRTQARVVIVAITFKYFEEANVIWVLWLATHGGGPTGRDGTQSFPDQRKQGPGTYLLVLALRFVVTSRAAKKKEEDFKKKEEEDTKEEEEDTKEEDDNRKKEDTRKKEDSSEDDTTTEDEAPTIMLQCNADEEAAVGFYRATSLL